MQVSLPFDDIVYVELEALGQHFVDQGHLHDVCAHVVDQVGAGFIVLEVSRILGIQFFLNPNVAIHILRALCLVCHRLVMTLGPSGQGGGLLLRLHGLERVWQVLKLKLILGVRLFHILLVIVLIDLELRLAGLGHWMAHHGVLGRDLIGRGLLLGKLLVIVRIHIH